MPTSRRQGFTFIEILMVMLVIGVLSSIGVPRYRNMKERAFAASMKSDLGTLRTAQEGYYAENQVYALDPSKLDFRVTSSVTLTITATDPQTGYQATARHANTPTSCTTAVGSMATTAESGNVVCDSAISSGFATPPSP